MTPIAQTARTSAVPPTGTAVLDPRSVTLTRTILDAVEHGSSARGLAEKLIRNLQTLLKAEAEAAQLLLDEKERTPVTTPAAEGVRRIVENRLHESKLIGVSSSETARCAAARDLFRQAFVFVDTGRYGNEARATHETKTSTRESINLLLEQNVVNAASAVLTLVAGERAEREAAQRAEAEATRARQAAEQALAAERAAAEAAAAAADLQRRTNLVTRRESKAAFARVKSEVESALGNPRPPELLANAKAIAARVAALEGVSVIKRPWPKGLANTPNALRKLAELNAAVAQLRAAPAALASVAADLERAFADLSARAAALQELRGRVDTLDHIAGRYAAADGDPRVLASQDNDVRRLREAVETARGHLQWRSPLSSPRAGRFPRVALDTAKFRLDRVASDVQQALRELHRSDPIAHAEWELQGSTALSRATVTRTEWPRRVKRVEAGIASLITARTAELTRVLDGDRHGMWFGSGLRHLISIDAQAQTILKQTQHALTDAIHPDLHAAFSAETSARIAAALHDVERLLAARTAVPGYRADGMPAPSTQSAALRVDGLNDKVLEAKWNGAIELRQQQSAAIRAAHDAAARVPVFTGRR